MKLFYKEVGSGEPLVIVHGLFGSGDNWMTLARQLSAYFRVILPDMRCHGKSGNAMEINYDLMAQDLHELLQELGISRIYLAGHSMGGKVAMKFVDLYPEMVVKLMVIDIANRVYNLSSHHEIINAVLSVPLDENSTRTGVEAALAKSITHAETRQFILKSLGRDAKKHLAWDIPFETLQTEIDNIGTKLTFRTTFALPTLVVNGSKSDYVLAADIDALKLSFVNLKTETIRGAGHWVHAERPQEMYNSFYTFFHE